MKGMMKMEKSTPRKNQLLMEAVSASEKASIQLREFAAATLPPEQTGPNVIFADTKITVSATDGFFITGKFWSCKRNMHSC